MGHSIILAEDHAGFRETLEKFLKPHYEIAASVADGQALVEAALIAEPDLIIADICLPILNGFGAARRVKAVLPQVPIIFVSGFEEPAFLIEARKAGGAGFVVKRRIHSDLLLAISKVLEGSSYFSGASLEEDGSKTACLER